MEVANKPARGFPLESVVRQIQNDDEDFLRIKELVRQAVEQSLSNHRHVLKIAFLSVIDSCRRDPVKFNILYYNLPPAATTETRLLEFGNIDQLFLDEHQHRNANDAAYWKFLVDEAEQFFSERVKELEQLSINRLNELFISAAISSQLVISKFKNFPYQTL